jgi:two-component system CheB/CheR fusion protein
MPKDEPRLVDGAVEDPDGAEAVSGEPVELSQQSSLPYLVAAIGASAGGLKAYIDLISNLTTDTGMCFILVPHLAAEHESQLVSILSRYTSLPVSEVQQGVRPEPNHIYVLPPNRGLSIRGGILSLEPRLESDRIPRPIDHFFKSLAYDQKSQAIGVMLSGTNADGAAGLKVIKGEGGIAIVQEPASAQFEEMPRSGIAADHVDLIVPPAEIAHELIRLGRQFREPSLQPLGNGSMRAEDEQPFAKILVMLRSLSGIDFRLYKPTTLRRRMARRMMLIKVDRLADYLRILQGSPQELRDLQDDLLINVTRFFRDADVFDVFKREIVPRIIANRSTGDGRAATQQIRVWAAGCSTGEEVYSIAMCLLEILSGDASEPSIQIFGTDASEDAIEKARLGIYPETITSEVSPDRLRRFFSKVDQGYQIAKRVRDLCIFARQNLCNDPPFSRLDLISCRNVLIYLGSDIQRSIISTFNYALRPNGYLLLGNSESLRDHSELFVPADRRNKFYSKVDGAARTTLDISPRLTVPDGVSPLRGPQALGWSDIELQRSADRIVVARYAPPGVVINDRYDVLQIRGHTSEFLEIPPGASPSLHLLRMVRETIAGTVRDAVSKAITNDVPVRIENMQMKPSDPASVVTLEVLPIHGMQGRPRCFLVLFIPRPQEPAEKVADSSARAAGEPGGRDLGQLQEDLNSTRLYLQSLIEERDARNQELTSAYEELQSANEEMQLTNEELETAKEELQSSIEELQTVNEELRNRNLALVQASNDLLNLFNSVNIPVVMLGNDLKIRHFTPPTERMMHVRASDIGRPIGEIRLNLVMDDLEPMLQEVLDNLVAKEVEVKDCSGRSHLLRIRPYRTTDNKIEGLVVVLLDIDQIRRSEEAMRQARDFSQRIIDTVPIPLAVLDQHLAICDTNRAFRALAGTRVQDLERRPFLELTAMLWHLSELRVPFEDLLKAAGSPPAGFDVEREGDSGAHIFRVNARYVTAEPVLILVTLEDVTERKEAERVLQNERQRLAGQVQTVALALDHSKEELRALTASLFTSHEDERRRIARELHDEVSQALAIIEDEIEQLASGPERSAGELRNRLGSLRHGVSELSEEVRRITKGLHPSVLEDLGLAEALRQLVREFGEREGMLVTFADRAVPSHISTEPAAALYRIAQEALWNVAKHAGKTHVKVTLVGVDNAVQLTVRDLGEGFDIGEVRGRGLGLISMEERARWVGGSLQIDSTPGEGTSVEAEVPLYEQPAGISGLPRIESD